MSIENESCRIAYFLARRRSCNNRKFKHITRDRSITKAMHSMYWRMR
jgi:hypothetical protein